jgi:hypothetical protein
MTNESRRYRQGFLFAQWLYFFEESMYMKLPKFSKNKLSGAIFLLLIILLSQSNILDMLFNTTLGRLTLVSLILGAGYLNKFMGIAAVLIAVVMFSSFGNVFEGMQDPTADQMPKTSAINLIKDLEETIDGEIEKKAKERKEPALDTDVATTTTTEAFSSYDMIGKERTMQLGMKSKQVNNSRQTSGNVSPFSLSTLFSSPLTFSSF